MLKLIVLSYVMFSSVWSKAETPVSQTVVAGESIRSPTAGLLKNPNLNQKALKQAFQFFYKNKSKWDLSERYLAIADFSQPSSAKRLAIINIQTGSVDFFKVSHGRGSDSNHDLRLDRFLNTKKSFATPAGFHKMTATYQGQHGLSLKMLGLEDKNSNSMSRAIVLHGADYVSWSHTGRSHGCPAVEKHVVKKIIAQLKGGALFYHFK